MRKPIVIVAALAVAALLFTWALSGKNPSSPSDRPVVETAVEQISTEAEDAVVDEETPPLDNEAIEYREVIAEEPAQRRIAIRVVDAQAPDDLIELAKLQVFDSAPEWDKMRVQQLDQICPEPEVLDQGTYELVDPPEGGWLVAYGPWHNPDGTPCPDPDDEDEMVRGRKRASMKQHYAGVAWPIPAQGDTLTIDLKPLTPVPVVCPAEESLSIGYTLVVGKARDRCACVVRRRDPNGPEDSTPRDLFESGYVMGIETERPKNLLYLASGESYLVDASVAGSSIPESKLEVAPGVSLELTLPRIFRLDVLCNVDADVWFQLYREGGRPYRGESSKTENRLATTRFSESGEWGATITQIEVRAAKGSMAARQKIALDEIGNLESRGKDRDAEHYVLNLELTQSTEGMTVDLSGTLPDNPGATRSFHDNALYEGIEFFVIDGDGKQRGIAPPCIWWEGSRLRTRWVECEYLVVQNFMAGQVLVARDGDQLVFDSGPETLILGAAAISRALTREATGILTTNVNISLVAEIPIPEQSSFWCPPISYWWPHTELPTTEVNGVEELTHRLKRGHVMQFRVTWPGDGRVGTALFDVIRDGDNLRVDATPQQVIDAMKSK